MPRRFTSYFLGCVSPSEHPALRLPPPPFGDWDVHTAHGFRLASGPDTAATIPTLVGEGGDAQGAESPHAWIRGRAYSLSGRALEGLGQGREAGVRDALVDLDGKFALCLRMPSGEVIVAADFLGTAGPYIAESNGQVLFSSHLGLLLQALPQWPGHDELGLAAALTGSFSIDGRTPYRGVRRLGPGEYVTIDEGRPRRQQYVDPLEVLMREPVDPAAQADELLDTFESLFQQAVQRERWREPVVVMLSGGKDSRALALALTSWRPETTFTVATYGSRRSVDRRRGVTAARRLGLPQRLVPYGDWTFETYADLTVGLQGGFSGLQTAHNLVGFEDAGRSAQTAVIGFLGGALAGAHLDAPATADRFVAVATPFRRWSPLPLERYLGESLAALEAALRDKFAELAHLEPHHRLLYLDLVVRQACWISGTFDIAQAFVEVANPFYDRRLLQFAFGLPQEWLRGQRLYGAWLDARFRSSIRQRGWRSQLEAAKMLPFVAGHRALDHVRRPTPTLDWREPLERSRPWLVSAVEKCTGNATSRAISSDSLRSLPTEDPLERPALLLALPLCLAEQRWHEHAAERTA